MNRQIGVGELKYGVTGDPLFTSHVTQPNFGQKIGLKRPLQWHPPTRRSAVTSIFSPRFVLIAIYSDCSMGFGVFVTVNRLRERVGGLQFVSEGHADDEVDNSQTGVYDNIDNVQQQLTIERRRRSRRNQHLNHAGAVHDDDAAGTSSPTVAVGAAAAGTEAGLNSMLSGEVKSWTAGVRRRGRCADRLASNRVVGPSFVSSARVQLGGNSGFEQQQTPQQSHHHHQQQQQQHSEQSVSHCTTTTTQIHDNEATSLTAGDDCIETGYQPAGSKPEPPWNGYDNVVELKEAIFSTAAAKMAAGLRTKSGIAGSTAVPSGGISATDEGPLSEMIPPPSSSRAIGERVVDVHRQRLSTASRELTTADHGVHMASSTTTQEVLESSVTIVSSDVSSETAAALATSVDAAQTQDHSTNSGTASTDVAGSNISCADNSVTNGDSQQNKQIVSFEKEDANVGETKVVASRGRKHKNKDKPPIGKSGSDSSKKVERKSEPRKEKTESKSAAESEAASEQHDHVTGRTEQPVGKISFLKSLLTRSRSPSPKRSTGSSNDRSTSPMSLGRDVAKRLSDPLKSSFKQTPDAPVVKVSVKQRDKNKKKKQSSADNEKNRSQQTSDHVDNCDCKEVLVVNSSRDESVEETTPSLTKTVKSSATQTSDDRSEAAPASEAEILPAATNSSGRSDEQQEIWNASHTSVSCPSTESAVIVTTASTLPMSPTAGITSTASGVVEQSPDRRRSATIITLRSATSSGSEPTTNWLSANQMASTVPCSELHNPWLVNIKEFGVRPNLDSFEGEKVFKKGTATTRLVLPGFARSQQDFLTTCDSELRSEALQRLTTTTTRKSPLDRRDRHSAITSPIYDTVYEEYPLSTYKSTTELMGNRHQSNTVQRVDDIGKSYSLQDLKLQGGMRQTSKVSGDAATSGRIRTPTTTEHAIDDHDYAGYVVRGRGDCGSAPSTSPKPVKTVTFKDDVDTDCPSVQRRLESDHGYSKTETSTDGKFDKDFSAALSTRAVRLPVSRIYTPANADRCVKMTKSSSLPVCGQPTFHSGSVDMRADVTSALRDTITSCDLEELPKYLADMYRQQKLERRREEELAARDRERLENIDKMWKEFESQMTVPAADVTSSITNSTKSERTDDSSRINTQAAQRKPGQQVLVLLIYRGYQIQWTST